MLFIPFASEMELFDELADIFGVELTRIPGVCVELEFGSGADVYVTIANLAGQEGFVDLVLFLYSLAIFYKVTCLCRSEGQTVRSG